MATRARVQDLSVAGVTVPLPTFFPAISSVKTRLKPLEYLRVLDALEYRQFLISAYDVYHSPPRDAAQVARLLQKAADQRRIILMDSGNYEAYWHRDIERWTERKLTAVLRKASFHFAFAFDTLAPSRRNTTNVRGIESSAVRAQGVARVGTIIPIVHGEANQLPELVLEVARRLGPMLVAVTERELGDGLIERARTITNIRRALNEVEHIYHPLHILGTGNPLSILVYSVCGADSFDGLEWCQTAADSKTARLYHFAHWDLFQHQSGLDLSRVPYATRVLTHNLWFYNQWLHRVRNAIHSGRGVTVLEEHLPREAVEQIGRIAAALSS